ncbi:MAG TPA: ATP-binding cassette domain-containing protein [Solirubrobacterales bacterium]|nr:ATP-binding cassette domain-containing protein [Solirubrobacterales bacterium]
MAEPVLRAEGFSYSYPGGPPALRGLELGIEPGEFVVLAGRSGSGKSTLLRAACGLVPHFHGGEVAGGLEVAGHDVRSSGPAELASVVGTVTQEPETQVVSATVRAEIELPLELRGASPAVRSRAVEEVALALAIPDLLERTTDTLSGGELQRVALAAALAIRPRLVLLDEPTSQLDPVAGDELISLLRRLNEEWGVAVLLGEHRLERCLSAADRVIALDSGSIAYDGPPGAFLEWALSGDPALATPGARLLHGIGLPAPASVREARNLLAAREIEIAEPARGVESSDRGDRSPRLPRPRSLRRRRGEGGAVALAARDLWIELGEGIERIEALRGVELEVARGERVALMGRNGAGKSTLLRAAAGLLEPRRGRVDAPLDVALLPQRPGDLFPHERVGDELPGDAGAAALRRFGLEGLVDADPRDLSGGERQRLALAIVVAGRGPGELSRPGALLLDEPTRGMDRRRKLELAALAGHLAEEGTAVIVATHDVEFAATFAERVVLLGRGEVVADGPVRELLAGGWYFSSEVARILDGAAVSVDQGVALLESVLGRDDVPTPAPGVKR